MLIPVFTKQFEKDFKRYKRDFKLIQKFKLITAKLIKQEKLEQKYRDHKLGGKYTGRRECHISPDWLLIYKIEGEKIIFERTGSHSELFK